MTNKQDKLYELMSDISEECYCAGWMTGNEFFLWSVINGGNRKYGMGVVTDDQIQKLKSLSEELGGWIFWYDSGSDSDKWGPKFITMEKWLEMVKDESL